MKSIENDLREVEYTREVSIPETASVSHVGKKKFIGYFHRWGDSWMYAEDTKIPFTQAIIEDKESGKIFEVDPSDIKFNN